MRTKAPLNEYSCKLSLRKGFPIFSQDRIRLDFVTILVLNVIFFWIIPIDFGGLIHPILDIRNLSYILIISIFLFYFKLIRKEVHKTAKIIWILFLVYFVLEYMLYKSRHGQLTDMYYAVWMLVTIGSIFYVGGSPHRLSMFFKLFVIAIGFSVFWGLLMVYVGEPFTTLRNYLIGVTEKQVDFEKIYGLIRESDAGRLVGFSKSIFGMSYLLATLPVSSFALFQYSNTRKAKSFWCIIFTISILGIFVNAERSSALSSFTGLVFLYSKSLMVRNKRRIMRSIMFATLLFLTFILFSTFVKDKYKAKEKSNLIARLESNDLTEPSARIFQQVAGLETVLNNPLGVEDYNEYYDNAYKYEAVRAHYGVQITAPHNHYLNVGMHIGWAGWFLVVLIFIYVKKRIDIFKQKARLLENRFIWVFYGIVTSFFVVLLNACFHNTGLFFAEPASMLMLALTVAGAGMSLKSMQYS